MTSFLAFTSIFLLFVSYAHTAPLGTQFKYDDGILVLNDKNFDEAIKEFKHVLVAFYAPWCGHCKRLLPQMSMAAKELETLGSQSIKLAKVDATNKEDSRELVRRYPVGGYPTIYFISNGKEQGYTGGRKQEQIIDWLKAKVGPAL